MITKQALNESVSLATQVIKALIGTVSGSSIDGGRLVYDGGLLLATLATQITGETVLTSLSNLFEETRTTGATLPQFEAIRQVLLAMSPVSLTAIALQVFSIQMCLVEQSQILSVTTFTARPDIDAAIDAINAAFNQALETAANAYDSVAYQTLTAVAAATSEFLNAQSITLPQIVYFSFPNAMPSLWLAQRIYQDGTRERQLALENQAVHPLFLESPVRALSQ
jgi:prophage DNA circulation protein